MNDNNYIDSWWSYGASCMAALKKVAMKIINKLIHMEGRVRINEQ